MARGKRKSATKKLLGEIRDQLVLQAERWGRVGYYTPMKIEEMVLEQCRNVHLDLLQERANLDYELQMLESDSQDIKIKLERLESYLKKAKMVIIKHKQSISRELEKKIKDKDKLKLIMSKLKPENSFSVLLNSN